MIESNYEIGIVSSPSRAYIDSCFKAATIVDSPLTGYDSHRIEEALAHSYLRDVLNYDKWDDSWPETSGTLGRLASMHLTLNLSLFVKH